MPSALNNITNLGNLLQDSKGKFFQVQYLGKKPDVDGWHIYDLSANPPATRLPMLVWYRLASRQRRVEVSYRMQTPLEFISGDYRIEVFVPNLHATVTQAAFTVTDRLDEAGLPVETPVTVNMRAASNEWVSLGDYSLDLEKGPLIGRVRQFDDTTENLKTSTGQDREVSFGPVRWVPLYQVADPLYVGLDDPQYAHLQYLVEAARVPTLEAQWSSSKVFDLADTRREWRVKLRRRSTQRQLQIDYSLPESAPKGRYRIETFIPQAGAHSNQAVYTIKTGKAPGRGRRIFTEETVKIDQSKFRNQWVSLGEFELEPAPQRAPAHGSLVGQVSQFDDCEDVQNRFITFGPVRWVPRFKAEVRPSQLFDVPIGAGDQRSKPLIKGQFGTFGGSPKWLDDWVDSTPFLTPYELGIHTGADLNLIGAEDFLSPVFAAGDGKVRYAGPAAGGWNFIIVIEHPLAWVRLPDGRKIQGPVFTRYGHVASLPPDNPILVETGEQVLKGQKIGFIGLPRALNPSPHLHFDVSHTSRLDDSPAHWPDWSLLKEAMQHKASDPVGYQLAVLKIQNVVRQDYLDPLGFLIDNHTPGPPP